MVHQWLKITLGEMRAASYECCGAAISNVSHSTVISAEQWSDDVRLSDIEPQFVCSACGLEGAELRAELTVR